MLAVFKRLVLCIFCVHSCLWPSIADPFAIRPKTYVMNDKEIAETCIKQSLQMKDCLDLHDLIIMIVQVRDFMITQGYEFPPFPQVLDACREQMRKDGLEICDAEFEALGEEFKAYDNTGTPLIEKVRHHKKKISTRTKRSRSIQRLLSDFSSS